MSRRLHNVLSKAMHNDPKKAADTYNDAHPTAYVRYKEWWPLPDGATGPEANEARKHRQEHAEQVAIDYYDLVSQSYEQGWGQQFHFGPFTPGLSIKESLIEYEKLIGRLMDLKEGMKVLDVGCGIGGPARTLAKEFKVKVVGVTNSAWHVQRGRKLNQEAALQNQVGMVQADFNCLPFEDNTFDAAYAFESICYAPDPTVVYTQLHRVLKPNARFSLHEWVMTDAYDPTNDRNRLIRDGIEHGMGLTKIPLRHEVRDGLRKCGFATFHEEPMEYRSRPGPWYFPLLGMTKFAMCKEDFWKTIVMERKFVVPSLGVLNWLLVNFRKVPEDFPGTFEILKLGTKSVAIGGKIGIFSPMMVFISKSVK